MVKVTSIAAFVLAGFVALASFGFGAKADLAGDAQIFIDDLGKRAIAVFADDGLSPKEKADRFRNLFNEGFAVRSLAAFTLGRYHKKADSDYLDRFVPVFDDYISLSYSARFSTFSGEVFEVLGATPDTDGRGNEQGVRVLSQIMNPDGSSAVRVDWRVRDYKGRPIVVDVLTEGVSMAITQQKEFASVISNNGGDIDALVDVLSKKNAELRQ